MQIGYLGAGGFGYVSLQGHIGTKVYYALKAFSQGHLVMNGRQDIVMQEKEIFMLLLYDGPAFHR